MRKNLLLVVLAAILSLGVFWLPLGARISTFWGIDFAQRGMETIVQNFDGLNYLVITQTGYDPAKIEQLSARFLTGNDPIYFAAHFPLYPLLVKLFDYITTLPNALLLAIVVTNIALAASLYAFFAAVSKNSRLSVILTCVALFFPARMLSVRAVGSSEPLFIALLLASLTGALRGKYVMSATLGALAVLTRSPGILLFGVYLLRWFRQPKTLFPYLLMPATLLAWFGYLGYQYGDPLAYFHSGDNLHLFFPPFQIFSNMQSWISDMWREDIVYLYLFYGVGVWQLRDRLLKYWGWIYGGVLLLVAHRDLARYALPLSPIALLGYAPWLEKIPKKVWLAGALLLIPIYLLGWQFVLGNIQPISDWSVFL